MIVEQRAARRARMAQDPAPTNFSPIR